ncbi:MAG TPA: ATP-dependent DNA helicase [Mycobacteriales bacterium]|nr:ATP-dependent DNA helicase [Mycobacteriales bacterium]
MAELTPEASGRYLRTLLGDRGRELPLTDEQLAVATHPLAPQLVVAGAGSGKTAVMAARVVHLVAFHQVDPAAVLGLTFTNKAAAELAERVRRSLRKLALCDEDAELPTVSTYHAYAASVVRDHALRIGREPSLQLLTEATQWQLAMRAVRRARGPFEHLPWTPANVAAKVLALDGELSEHLVPVDAVREYDAALIASVDTLAKATKDITGCADAARARDELLDLVGAYRALKVDLDLMDFGDQVALAAQIAASPEVAALERARFAVVVLDEYQDTGVAQRVLLQRLFGGGHPVTAVGDPNQAIYGWRGASVGNLIGFFGHFADGRGDAQPLMTSFRCGGRILDVANAAAAPLRSSADVRGRSRLDVRELGPTSDRGDEGDVVIALHTDAEAEARWVADQVRATHETGTSWSEVAVLCRRRADFAHLHRALVEADVPAEVVGLGGLLQMPEVADVVAVLQVLVDPTANPAVVRLLTGPRWRIGPRDLAALGHRAHRLTLVEPHDDDAGETLAAPSANPLVKATQSVDPVDVVSLLDAIESPGRPESYSPEAVARLAAFRDEVRSLRPLVTQPVVEVVATVVRRTGLGVEVESDTAALATARAANLAAFGDHAAHFTGLEGESDLRAFLAYLAAAADEEDGLDVGGVSSADTVKLLTVHKAKGLEWDVVVLPGMSTGVFPSTRGRARWTSNAHVLPYSLRGDAADLPADPAMTNAALREFAGDCKADDRDEERRLLYVAITRARRRVVASGSWWSGTRSTAQGASEFLAELHAHEHATEDVWVAEGEAPEENPLLAAAREDVAWPRPYDETVVSRRRAAAAAVTAARSGKLQAPLLGGVDGDRLERWQQEARLLVAELRHERSVERVVPLPRRLTASQVVALSQDPEGLAHRLARPMPAAPMRQARRGTRFHAWVESLFGARPLLEPEDLPGAMDGEISDAELVELQQAFLASPWGERRPHAVEAPFELVVGGRLLRGRIDAVYANEDGRYDVIDYKTGAVPTDFASAALQLSVYRLAWAGIAAVDPGLVDAGFLYIRTGEVKRPQRLHSADSLAALIADEVGA